MEILDVFGWNKRRQRWRGGFCDVVLQHKTLIDKRAPIKEFDCAKLVEQTESRERLHKRAETWISKIDCK